MTERKAETMCGHCGKPRAYHIFMVGNPIAWCYNVLDDKRAFAPRTQPQDELPPEVQRYRFAQLNRRLWPNNEGLSSVPQSLLDYVYSLEDTVARLGGVTK